MASVSSHGGTEPASPRNGSSRSTPDGRALPVGGGQGLDDAGQPPEVVPEMLAEPVDGRGVEAHRQRPFSCSASQLVRSRPVPAELSITVPTDVRRLHQRWGTVPPPATSTRKVDASGSFR